MSPLFRASNQLRRIRSSQLILAILGTLLVTAVACGTDRAGENNEVAASSFQVEGDTLTWVPPWDEGDARKISVTSSVEFSDEWQRLMELSEGDDDFSFLTDQSSTVGTISILSKNGNGSTGEFNISIQELIAQLDNQEFEQPGFGEADFGQLTSLMGLADQLDLGVEFGIGADGSLSGVTNLEELAETVSELVDSLLLFAAFAGDDEDEMIPEEDVQKIKSLLEDLPKTDAAKLAADSGLNLVTANLFLMRSGDYSVGEQVDVFGNTPSILGISTDGKLSYVLTDISNGTATVQVSVLPGDIDLLGLMQAAVDELAGVVGEDASEIAEKIADLTAQERSQVEAISSIAFTPYTVTLTLDVETGWVTAADWSVELSLPENFEELLDEDDRDFEDFDLSDLNVTITSNAKFEEVVVGE